MKYGIWFAPAAFEELSQLDAKEMRRVVLRIHHLARNIEEVSHEALQGRHQGRFKMRTGNDRIVYDFVRSERILRVHAVGHRSEVYEPYDE